MNNDWISVEDRLPNKENSIYGLFGRVFVVMFSIKGELSEKTRYYVGITQYFKNHGFADGDFNTMANGKIHPITHWMPLPETPKE